MSGATIPPAEKAVAVHERLRVVFGDRPTKTTRDPMRTLVGAMLSHRTTNENTTLALDRLLERFGSWEAIRDAAPGDVIDAVAPATFPEVKGPNIQKTIARIVAERGEPRIDFLRDLPAEDGLRWLTALPGVGIKTATLTLLFVFQKPVMPVDTHVHRVSRRVGLIASNVSAEKAHRALLALLPPDAGVLYTFHKNVMTHGQRICVWEAPRCERCPLTDLCDWYAAHRLEERG